MGLISRVSSRTYRQKKLAHFIMAETEVTPISHEERMNKLSKRRANGKSWKPRPQERLSIVNRKTPSGKKIVKSWALKQQEKLDRKQFLQARNEVKEANDLEKREKREKAETKKALQEE